MTALFLSVLKQSLFAIPILCAVLLLRQLFPRVRHAAVMLLWGVVAVSLLLFVRLESDFSLLPVSFSETTVAADDYTVSYIDDASTPVDIGLHSMPKDSPADDILPDDAPFFLYEVPITSRETISPIAPSDLFAALWIIGMTALAGYTVISYLRLRRRTAVSASAAVGIRICDHIDTPFILGFLRPVICLPSAGFSREVTAAVLLHEKAHLTRFDHLKKLFAFLLCILHSFNPVVWLAYLAFCRDLELYCDDTVTREMTPQEKCAYADALLACSIGRGRYPSLSCALAFGEVGVKKRIRRIFDNRRAGIVVSVVCIALIAVIALCFLTVPRVTTTDIYEQNGFRVTAIAENLTMAITIPYTVLDETAYTEEGQHFADGDVVIHRTDTTTVSLVHVDSHEADGLPNRKSEPYLTFTFRLTYDNLASMHVITALSRPNYRGEELLDYTVNSLCPSALRIGCTVIYDGIRFSGSAYGTEFSVSMDEEVVRTANHDLHFSLSGFCDIYYEAGKPDPAQKINMLFSGSVTGQSEAASGYNTTSVVPYVTEHCLYMTPLSSRISLGGNNGELYALIYGEDGQLTRDFGRYDRSTGRSRILFDVGDAWCDLPFTADEWDALFVFGGAPDLSRFTEKRCLPLHQDDMLLQLDAALWYCKTHMEPDGTQRMWSIHTLVPEAEMGEAYFTDAPMLDHIAPYFQIRFDFPALTQLSVSCTDALLSLSDSDGFTHTLQNPDGGCIRMIPRDNDGRRLICSEISFCAETEGNPTAVWGTIYVEQYRETGDGRFFYRATVVGEGLHISEDGAGGAILSFAET